MATDIVPSLFGITPESYQRAQQQAAADRAIAFAQLDPFAQASYGLGMGAFQLGRALGGEDPQLRMISFRNAIAKQMDPTDPQTMVDGIQALYRAGDTVGAMQANAVYQQVMKSRADIAQSQAAMESSRASAAKSAFELSKAQREDRERLQAEKEGVGPAPVTQAQGQVAAQPVQPVTVEGIFSAPPQGFEKEVSASGRPMPEYLQRAIKDYNLYSALAAGVDQPYGYAGPSGSMLNQATRERFASDAQTIAQQIEESFGVKLLKPYGLPQAPAQQTAAAAPVPAAVAPAAVSQGQPTPEVRLQQITARLAEIRPRVAAGARNFIQERNDLLEEQKQLRELTKPTPLNRLIAEREAAIRGGADFNSTLIKNYDAAISKETGQQLNFGERANRYAPEMFNGTPYANLNSTQQALVNKRITDEDQAKAKAGATVMPGQPIPPKNWIEFEKFMEGQPTFKQTSAMISAAPSVLRIISQSTSNDFASKALPTSLAKLFDQGTLSNQDVSRYARTGGLDDRLAAMASEFFTGRVTSVTKEQAQRFMSAVYRGALLDQRAAYVSQADIMGYDDSPSFKKRLKQIDDELAKFKPSSQAATPASGGASVSTTTGNALVDKYLNPR